MANGCSSMLLRCFLLLFAVCTGASSQTSQTASVQGTVREQSTGKPLSGVHVLFIAYGPDNMPAVSYGAMTTASGNFSVTGIPPNSYMIMLERRGFAFVSDPKNVDAAGTVNVKPGEQIQDMVLEMAPRAVISGRVLDEYGDPVMNAQVTAIPVRPRLLMDRFPREISANDRGEFRLSLPPGKYYIKAFLWSPFSGLNPLEVRTDGTVEAKYVETYYPGANGMENATKVEAKAGRERGSIEITLARQPVLSISGGVSGYPENADLSTLGISVRGEWGPKAGNMTSTIGTGLRITREGKFENKFRLGQLGAGFYRVYAECACGDHTLRSPAVELTLVDSSVEDLNLALVPGFDVSGTVEVAGKPSQQLGQSEGRTVKLHPVGRINFDQYRLSPIDAEGRFRIKDVFAERYSVDVTPLPENGFVKTVWLNGTAVPDGILDFSNGGEGGEVKITLSTNGAQLAGRIENSKGEVVPVLTAVILAPDQQDVSFDRFRFANASPKDGYKFEGLPPGKYRVLAISALGGGMRDLQEVVTRPATPDELVEIKEGERVQKNLKLASDPGDR